MTKTWILVDRQRTELPGFDPRWLPRTLSERCRVTVSGERVWVEVDGWVGSGRLSNGDLIRIDSKYGEVNYLRMLAKVLGVQDLSERVVYMSGLDETPIAVFARSFVDRLRVIQAMGVAAGRIVISVSADYIPRKLDARRTALGMRQQVVPRLFGWNHKRTEDTPANRVLGAAATAVLTGIPHLDQSDQEVLGHFGRRWAPPRPHLTTSIAEVTEGLRRDRFSGSRAYYVPALQLGLLLLGATGASSLPGSVVEGDATLVNSDWLFEAYVRTLLIEVLTPEGFVVGKIQRGEKHLFTSGEVGLEPDIVIRRGATVTALGDVKHKTPGPDDYYQLVAYAREWGMSRVFIMQATSLEAALPRPLTVASDGTQVSRVELPVRDLDLVEERLRSARQLLAL